MPQECRTIFTPTSREISDDVYGTAHFGGNFLALNDRLAPGSTFPETAKALDLQYLRYPGGALTEYCFSIKTADADVVIDRDTGEELPFVSISDMLSFAESEGMAVDLVIPTWSYLSEETDDNGDRHAAIDEFAVRGFVSNLANGVYEGKPDIASFEIGNEYWGSGHMNAVEYGRVASGMAEMIADEISRHPNAEIFDDTDILVQMGMNYGFSNLTERFPGTALEQISQVNATYDLDLDPDNFIYSGSGSVAWPKVNSEIVLRQFETPEQLDAVGGIVAHIYSRGRDVPNSRYSELSNIDDTWRQVLPDVDVHASEWNLKRSVNDVRTEEFGLKQAHEMLNLVEAFEWGGVSSAHVWPVQLNARTALAEPEGEGDLLVPGEMFRIMNEKLVGTRVMSLDGSTGRETEVSSPTADLHTFFSGSRLVTFIAGTTDQVTQQSVDFGQLLESSGLVSVTRLDVRPGQDPTASGAKPAVTVSYPGSIVEDGNFVLDLAPYEIAVVEANFPTFTDEVIAQAPSSDKPAPVNLLASIFDPAGRGVDGAILTFDPDDASPSQVLGGTSMPGGYGLPLARDMAGRLDGGKLFNEDTDPEIGVSDALDALRLAVDLEPSFGPAKPFDLIAADIDRDGEVSVGDALDILRFSVGIVSEDAPRWVFIDEDQDFSGLTQDNVAYRTGLDVDTAASAEVQGMTGILLGNVDTVT